MKVLRWDAYKNCLAICDDLELKPKRRQAALVKW